MSYFSESYDKKQISVTDATLVVESSPAPQKIGYVPMTSATIEIGDNTDLGNISSVTSIKHKRTETEVLAAFYELTQQYGINKEELLVLLEKTTGLNLLQLQNIDTKQLNKIKQAMSSAFADSTHNGNIDNTKALKLSGDYYRALEMGYSSVEKYKTSDKSTEDINARMTRFFDLEKKGIDYSKLSHKEQNEYINRYFNGYFNKKIAEILNNKGEKKYKPEDIDKMSGAELKSLLTEEEFQRIHNLQKRDFVVLLNNSSDEDKTQFWEGHKALLANNKLPALNSLIHSYENEELRTEHINENAVDVVKGLNTRDRLNNATSGDDNAQIVSILTQYGGKKALTDVHNEINASRKEFFEKNKEALEIIKEKEKNPNAKFTDEEKELIRQRDEYYTKVSAGEFIGASQNKVVNEEFITSHMEILANDAKESPIYEHILSYINEYIEKNPSILSTSKDEFDQKMNNATGGKYQEIVLNSSESIKTDKISLNNISNTDTQPKLNITDPIKTMSSNDILVSENTTEDINNNNEYPTSYDSKNPNNEVIVKKYNNFTEFLNNAIGQIAQKDRLKILNILEATSIDKLIRMFVSGNSKTKNFIYDNKLLSIGQISRGTTQTEQSTFTDEIKEKIEKFNDKT